MSIKVPTKAIISPSFGCSTAQVTPLSKIKFFLDLESPKEKVKETIYQKF